MEGRRYDLVIFGATGFTGQYVVDEVARVAQEENLTWAVAGRNMLKLQKVLSEASTRTGKNLDSIHIITADISSTSSLAEMARQAKVVLNCVGPYGFYGEPVVKACIEAGAHHLDISGERQFLEKMQLLYNAKAREKNVYVVGTVGFDSIPAEMGLVFMQNHFKDGELTNVESFLDLDSGTDGFTLNTGTLESAVNGFAHRKELKLLRKSLFSEPVPEYEYKLPKRPVLFFSKEVNKWCLPFPGSDKSVVDRTMRDLLITGRLEKPIEFIPYMCLPSLLAGLGLMVFGVFFALCACSSFGRSLLVKYAHIFTFGYFKKGGPTRKQIEEASFSTTFVGYGYKKAVKERSDKKPDRTVVTTVVGPEPGYVTTPICMVQASVTVLKDQAKMHHKGGVFTPGAVFGDTDLIDRLQRHNIKFSTVSDSSSTVKKD